MLEKSMTYYIQPQSDLEITFHYLHTLLMAFTRWLHYSAQPMSLASRGPFVSDTSPKCIDREDALQGLRKVRITSLISLSAVVKNVNKMLIKMATNINTGSIYYVYLLAYVCLPRNDSHWGRYYQTECSFLRGTVTTRVLFSFLLFLGL